MLTKLPVDYDFADKHQQGIGLIQALAKLGEGSLIALLLQDQHCLHNDGGLEAGIPQDHGAVLREREAGLRAQRQVQYSTVQYSAVLHEPNASWVHKSCDDTSWDAAPCSACSLAASVQINTEFKLLGLCER